MKTKLSKALLAAILIMGSTSTIEVFLPAYNMAFGEATGPTSVNGDSLLPSGSSEETECLETSFGCAR